MRRSIACVALLTLLSGGAPTTDLPPVLPNDNRIPAGRFSHDTLQLHLVVAMTAWRPQDATGPSIEVAAFGEEGKSAQIPGGLSRLAGAQKRLCLPGLAGRRPAHCKTAVR